MKGPDRLIWAAGLALAAVVLAGLVLNEVSGLTRLSWTITLVIGLAAGAVVFLLLRRRQGRTGSAAPVRPGRTFTTGAIVLLAVVLAGAAVWLGNVSAGWSPTPGFAQLWLVPGAGGSATLGVRDDYPGHRTFRLVLTRSGATVQSWTLTLAEGESWQRTVAGTALAATLSSAGQQLTVTS